MARACGSPRHARRRRFHPTPGAKAGAILRSREAFALARLLTRSGESTPGGLVAARPRALDPAPPGAAAAAWRTARRWALLVAAGWLLQVGVRLWFNRGQSVPLANPDESAYLIAARVLAGGPATDFSYSTLYQGGYPLLIAPVYWFTSNAVIVYHAVLAINAVVSALLMPLAYVTGRRLGLVRPAAYAVAMLTARSVRGQYVAAAGSALLAGYSYAVHSRGLVIVFSYVVVGVFVFWRRLVLRRTVLAAGVALAASAGGGWLLNRYLAATMYPEGARNLTAQLKTTLHSVNGAIDVFEMAAGQYWRLVLDSWGLAG